MQYIEIRALTVDSVLEASVPGSGLLRSVPGAGVVRCTEGEPYCRYNGAGDKLRTVPAIHDISGTAWGFLKGVRVYTRVLLRSEMGGEDDLWPQADDHVDVVLAYAEWSRRMLRIRGGRQWKVSGLGFYNYDGGSVQVRPWAGIQAEVYGGWSLSRGLNEPRTGSALAAIESFAPDERSLILGLSGSYRPSARFSVTGLYQREARADRKGLTSERLGVDALLRTGRLAFEGTFEADLASHTVNEALLRTRATLTRSLGLQAWVRRYQPFFELWTIWGAFSPVAFTEFGTGGSWSPSGTRATFGLSGSWRTYGETSASSTFGNTRSTAWRISATGAGPITQTLTLQGRYGSDVGFGAARSFGGLRIQWDLREGSHLGASIEVSETDFEFRVEGGTVYGAGVDGSIRLADRTALRGGLTAYRHGGDDSGSAPNWSQLRGFIRFDWALGSEAGGTPLGGVR
ncbi:MAG: hypothetical protein RQ751_05525 [Longimicrobiales bacterium]|nr:hypothetical protein [Longimicrobiales bacterium]